MLIENNASLPLIKERLGHDNIKTTIDTYGHLYPNKHHEVAEMLQDLRNESSNTTAKNTEIK
jgi:integrase